MVTPRVIASSGLPWQATVSTIISEGSWTFPNQPSLQDIWTTISFQPQAHRDDAIVWLGSSSGRFSTNNAWEQLRDRWPTCPLHHLIQFNSNIPRHAFILWLATRGRLGTMDRLWYLEVTVVSQCRLCHAMVECYKHLFFQCSYSRAVWTAVNRKGGPAWPNNSWNTLLQ